MKRVEVPSVDTIVERILRGDPNPSPAAIAYTRRWAEKIHARHVALEGMLANVPKRTIPPGGK
jgi:hypothetical protein